jgi:hypothetical protein
MYRTRQRFGSSIESYAELLANVSMSQGSLSKLVECLLGPSDAQNESQGSGRAGRGRNHVKVGEAAD